MKGCTLRLCHQKLQFPAGSTLTNILVVSGLGRHFGPQAGYGTFLKTPFFSLHFWCVVSLGRPSKHLPPPSLSRRCFLLLKRFLGPILDWCIIRAVLLPPLLLFPTSHKLSGCQHVPEIQVYMYNQILTEFCFFRKIYPNYTEILQFLQSNTRTF